MDANLWMSSLAAKLATNAPRLIFIDSGVVREKKECAALDDPGLIVILFSFRHVSVFVKQVLSVWLAFMAFSILFVSMLKGTFSRLGTFKIGAPLPVHLQI